MSERDAPSSDTPDFGPSGYLPERASKRARKIVLRAPLGVQWIVASLVFGLVVLATGLVFLLRSGAPEPPFVPVMSLSEVGDAAVVTEPDVLLVTAGGPIVAFHDARAHDLAYCPDNRRIEGADGQVWTLTGRGQGVPSLERYPVVVHDGTVYVDPTRRVPPPRPSDAAEEPVCR